MPREPISDRTAGQPLLDETAIARILDSVDLPLVAGITPQGFRASLNHLLFGSLLEAFGSPTRRARAEIIELRRVMQDFLRLQHRLRELGLVPPNPPGPWLGTLLGWLQLHEEEIKEPSLGGRYPQVLNTRVVPQMLGLVAAAFEQRPTPTAGRHADDGRRANRGGPAARFVKAVVTEVRCAIEATGFDEVQYGVERRDELTKLWTIGDSTRLEKLIERGLRQVRPAEPLDEVTGIGPLPGGIEWEIWQSFYRDQLRLYSAP